MSIANRFHDRAGQRVMTGPIQFADAVSSLTTAILRITTRLHPRRPWITLPAYRQLRRMVRSDWKIFEYGSGMSTLWYDRRCAEVHAVEENESWYRFVAGKLDKARVYHREGHAYTEAVLEVRPGHFDLIVVDGKQRLN